MISLRSLRQFLNIGLVAIGATCSGITINAQQGSVSAPPAKETRPQQGGGLTPPPKPQAPQQRNVSENSELGSPFVLGERLVFNVSFLNFPTAARLEMEVADQGQFFGQESYQIRTKVQTIGQVRSLFAIIDNQYISYITPGSAIPIRVVNILRQGNIQSEQTIVLDQTERQATYPDGGMLPIPAGIYDLPSLLYGLRLRPFPQGEKIRLAVLYGKEIADIEVEVKGHESITTQAGTFKTVCLKVSPQKKFSKYRTLVWLTDDNKKLPVLLKANFSAGEVRAELASAKVTARPLPALKTLTDESGSSGINGTNGKNGNERKLPFAIGEKLNYDIAWGKFASVGKASFEVRQQGTLNGSRVFELYAEATTRGAGQSLINVEDQLSSYVLSDKLTPVRTDERLREGKRSKQVIAAYNRTNNTATLSNGGAVSISPGTLDLVSLFYSIRAADLKIGATRSYPFLDANHRLRTLTARVVKQEPIEVPVGQRDSLQLDLLLGQTIIAQAWISNDASRLPLYIATRTSFGELRFLLTGTINTK